MLLTKIFIAPLFLLAATVNAGVIDYELTDLGSSNYRFDYTVNNTLGVDIEEITIFLISPPMPTLASPLLPLTGTVL